MNTLEQQHKKLEENVINIKSLSRRNNLLLDGIPEADNESSKDCFDKVYDILQQRLRNTNARQIKIVQCHRLARSTPNSTWPRTIIFKLHWFGDHDHIWDNRKRLQGSNVWLNEDFPTEITQWHRKLHPIIIESRRLHKKASRNVDKLIVEGHLYTIHTLGKLPVELSPAKVATISKGEVTTFFTSDSPFSNFNDCEITSPNGITYKWHEQLYQKDKSDEFGDHEKPQQRSCKLHQQMSVTNLDFQ